MTLIKLTEVLKNESDGFTCRPVLMNPEAIAMVQQKEIVKEGIPIVGENHSRRDVRVLTMRNNQTINIDEGLEDVLRLINSGAQAIAPFPGE